MSNEQHSFRDSDPLDEQLSAYLDNELPLEEANILKKRLAADDKLRIRLQMLKNNWELLGHLPREDASSNFAASTVEMVAIRASSAQPKINQQKSRFLCFFPRSVLIAVAALVAGVLGYVATTTVIAMLWGEALTENRNAFLLKHLTFLEHLSEYQLIEDLDFLAQINQIKYFSSRAKVSQDPGIARQAEGAVERKTVLVENMDSGRKKRLLAHYLDFRQLPEEEQNRLLALHADLLSAAKVEMLSKTLLVYAEWYQQQPPLEQVEIKLHPQREKIEYIQDLVKSVNVGKKLLANKDFFIIAQWLEGVVLRNEEKILQRADKFEADAISRLTGREKTRHLVLLLTKNINRSKSFLSTSIERKEYEAMKEQLSEGCQKNLADQPSFGSEIRWLIEVRRSAYRKPSRRLKE